MNEWDLKFWQKSATIAAMALVPLFAFHSSTHAAPRTDLRPQDVISGRGSAASGRPIVDWESNLYQGTHVLLSPFSAAVQSLPLEEQVRHRIHRYLEQDGDGFQSEDAAVRRVQGLPAGAIAQRARMLTGLSWPRIAELFGIERQTLYRWRREDRGDSHLVNRAISRVSVIEVASRVHPNQSAIRAWLAKPDPSFGISPHNLLLADRYSEAELLAQLPYTTVTFNGELWSSPESWDEHLADARMFSE